MDKLTNALLDAADNERTAKELFLDKLDAHKAAEKACETEVVYASISFFVVKPH